MELFVGSLPYEATATDLGAFFARAANVSHASVVHDRDSGRSKGFGYVDLWVKDDTLGAVEALKQIPLLGRPLSIHPRLPGTDFSSRHISEGHLDADESALEDCARIEISRAELWDAISEMRGASTTDVVREDTRSSVLQSALHLIRFVDDGVIEHLADHPDELLGLKPRYFEMLCAELLARQGFTSVVLTPEVGDGGVDIYATQNDLMGSSLYLIECKAWTPPHHVGRPQLQNLYGVLTDSRASKAVVATTSYFSQPALAWQSDKKHQLTLRDYDAVRAWLNACRRDQPTAPG
jgi:hypothetical protein